MSLSPGGYAEVERGTYLDECPRCESRRVYHDRHASDDRDQWYDCLGCGTRLLQRWRSEPDPDLEQEESPADRVSTFEMDFEL
jgi:DNA-directed RNA polymerase subunit RPC12/RpoP